MRYQIDMDTDIAAIGVWDAEAGDGKRGFADNSTKTQWAAWDEDVAATQLFVLETGSDGSYSAEFFIDEPVPADQLSLARTVNREYLLRCASGTLVAGGMEDYRSAKPKATDESSRMTVSPGPYRLRLHVGESEDQINEADLVTFVGAEDYAYYQKLSGRQSLGCLGVFLAFLPTVFFGANFWVCLIFGLVAGGVGYFLAGLLLTMNDRYQRVFRKVMEYHNRIPCLIFELTRIDEADAASLTGGRMRL